MFKALNQSRTGGLNLEEFFHIYDVAGLQWSVSADWLTWPQAPVACMMLNLLAWQAAGLGLGLGQRHQETKSLADLFTRTIWAYFVCLNLQHMKCPKKIKTNMIINNSRHVLWFVCFPVQNMPSSGLLGGTRVSLTTSRCRSCQFLCSLL